MSHVIEVEELSFTYPRAAASVLEGVSFTVERGEVFGFLGPSGAGKSTTQKVLTGVLPGYQGRVRVFDAEVAVQPRAFYERIGVSFEFPNVFGKLTALENLEFFRAMYRGETEDSAELLEIVGLGDAADRRAAEFSKGMKMRLNLCRALINRPELLFLDEPTGGQDPSSSRRIRNLVRELSRRWETTVVLTTHDMHVAAELCDRVAFIVDGRLGVIDSPRALMLRSGRRMVRVELQRDEGVQARDFELDGLEGNDDFLELLGDPRLETIHTLEATLEDVFVDVTGRRLS